jgi:hypothetical protein
MQDQNQNQQNQDTAENYFDKFVQDLAHREDQHRQHQHDLQRAHDMWEKRQELDRKYKEHTQQRIRYDR